MRDLVIDTIVRQFEKEDLDELGLGMIVYRRWAADPLGDVGRDKRRHTYLLEDAEREKIVKDLRGFCEKATNEELLQILDSQACYRYR